jgi:PhzF family phenazine biosynthesis protein
MNSGKLYRLSAFTTTQEGGNPAGVWIGDHLPAPEEMLRIAEQVGYSETAFIAPRAGPDRTVRYYSAVAEVAFCGHATIASGVQLGKIEGEGQYRFHTAPGTVIVDVRMESGLPVASLTSVQPKQEPVSSPVLEGVLAALGWSATELDPAIPPVRAYAGAWHLVIAAGSLERLNRLEYDFERLRSLMLDDDLTTVQLIWRESSGVIHARDPFPVGGVIEDPATGAAAAALGGYLRDAGLLQAPSTLVIRQGEAMGRPSRILVDVPVSGGVIVSGHAVELPTDYPAPTRRLLA